MISIKHTEIISLFQVLFLLNVCLENIKVSTFFGVVPPRSLSDTKPRPIFDWTKSMDCKIV